MLDITPSEIVKWFDSKQQSLQPLLDRMDADYSRYRLEPFDAGADYASYTSNDPMTFADKIMAWIVQGTLTVSIPPSEEPRESRDTDARKERFLLGCLNAADENLSLHLLLPLRNQLAFYTCLRGGNFGVSMLAKRSDGSTYVHIRPWDMRHMAWEVGNLGLAIACCAVKKTRVQIMAEYGVDIPNASNDVSEGLLVYDFYDGQHNTIMTADAILKPPTPHGSPRIPIFASIAPVSPLIQSDTVDDTIKDYAESVFKANREIYDNGNLIKSILLELVSRARKPPIAVTSRSGSKTLPEDPYKTGAEIALAEGEKVEAVKLIEAARETGAFLNIVESEKQRGGLPHSSFGELPFPVSGYAINLLRQGSDTPLQPRLQAVQNAYKQICDLLFDQYMTGAFQPFSVSGWDMGRRYFNMQITPESLQGAGNPEVLLVADLPQDDMSKIAMAQALREGPSPLASDLFIRDKIMGFQDADGMNDAINEQQAERVLPEAILYTLMQAAEKRGRPDLAGLYYGELVRLMIQKLGQGGIMPPGMGGGGEPQSQSGGPPTFNPKVMPNAAMGVNPPQPGIPLGQRPPGQPRPGAQAEETRLNAIGLAGPRQ